MTLGRGDGVERVSSEPSGVVGRSRFVEEGERSFWSFCVDFVDARGGSSSSSAAGGSWKRNRTDYREVLNAEDFAVFAKLREIRKAIAQAEGVPVYTIFTNEQLAQIVQARAATKSALEQVVGSVTDGWEGQFETSSRSAASSQTVCGQAGGQMTQPLCCEMTCETVTSGAIPTACSVLIPAYSGLLMACAHHDSNGEHTNPKRQRGDRLGRKPR